jgi:phenylalanyl-tRNA synthetase beta subunit
MAVLDGNPIGRLSVVDLALRRRMDEHLAAWSVVWAELRLSGLEALDALNESLAAIPPFPHVELDFSIVVPRSERFATVARHLRGLRNELLTATRFVTSFEGDPLPPDKRSVTLRCVLGHENRTLAEEDVTAFRAAFESHARNCGYELRTS